MAIDRRRKGNVNPKLSPREIQGFMELMELQEKREAEYQRHKRGLEAEDFVEEAILFLKSRGTVQWYHRCQRWGELDLRGMDFLITFTCIGTAIFPLQVKNSETGKSEHVVHYGNRIPCVVRYPLDTIEIMAGKILMTVFPRFYEEEEVDQEKRHPNFPNIFSTSETALEEPAEETTVRSWNPPSINTMADAMRRVFSIDE